MAEIHIAFAGNIGVGKTAFVQKSLREPNRSILLKFLKNSNEMQSFEEVPDNRVLEKFYQDPKRWAFASQMNIFTARMKVMARIMDYPGIALEDRTIYEDRFVFGQTNFEEENMNDTEFWIYDNAFKQIVKNYTPPTLLVYLKVQDVEVLKARIKERDRNSEKTISSEYLLKLNQNYDKFFKEYPHPKIIINAETDMIKYPDYHATATEVIAQKLREIGVLERVPIPVVAEKQKTLAQLKKYDVDFKLL